MKFFLLFIMLILNLSCDKYHNYPECFTEKNKNTFDFLIKNFEEQLNEKYNSNDVNFLYKSYLKDFSEGKIDEAFLLSNKTVDVLYSLTDEEFVEIWVLPLEDGTFFDENNPKLNPNDFIWSKYYILNPKEKFYKCGIKNSKNKELITFFDKSIEVGYISYDLLSSAFLKVVENEDIKKDYLTRLIIAIKFYYEISLYYSSIEIGE